MKKCLLVLTDTREIINSNHLRRPCKWQYYVKDTQTRCFINLKVSMRAFEEVSEENLRLYIHVQRIFDSFSAK